MHFFEGPDATETKELLVATRYEFNSSKEGDGYVGEVRAHTVPHLTVTLHLCSPLSKVRVEIEGP